MKECYVCVGRQPGPPGKIEFICQEHLNHMPQPHVPYRVFETGLEELTEYDRAKLVNLQYEATMGKPLRHPLAVRFHTILEELGTLHDKKQADYGRDNDPFANVRGSEDFGVPAWVGAMVRLNDKVRRLQKAARGGQLANESVVDSFNDLAVYAVIARILYEETQQ